MNVSAVIAPAKRRTEETDNETAATTIAKTAALANGNHINCGALLNPWNRK